MKILGPFLVGGMLLGSAVAGWAQSVSWNDPGPAVPNTMVQLELVFTDCQPQGNVSLPKVNGLQFLDNRGGLRVSP